MIKPLKVGRSGVKSYEKKHPDLMPELLEKGIEQVREKELSLMKTFWYGASNIPSVILYGPENLAGRCPIVSLNLTGIDSALVADAFWEEGEIAVRAGAHCAPLMHQSLGTVDQGVVRFSFASYNTLEEVDAVLKILYKLAKEMQL